MCPLLFNIINSDKTHEKSKRKSDITKNYELKLFQPKDCIYTTGKDLCKREFSLLKLPLTFMNSEKPVKKQLDSESPSAEIKKH